MAIDRELLVEVGYGQAGRPTCNLVPAPAIYASDNTGALTQDSTVPSLLEEAGWIDSDGDGIRDKDGVKLSISVPDIHKRCASGLPSADQRVVGADRCRNRTAQP